VPANGAKVLRLATGIVALSAVAAMYWILHAHDPAPDRFRNAVNYFSYFTILTNLLVGMACVAPVIGPEGRVGRSFLRPEVRAAVALYVILMALVYAVILAPIYHPQGAQKWVNHVLHRVVPLMYLADWALLVPKGALKPRDAAAWMAFPLVYGGYTLVHGAWSGWYPYPFMAVDRLGYPQVLANVVGLTAGFLLAGLLLIGADRMLSRNSSSPAKGD
jgi:hypothetical protein